MNDKKELIPGVNTQRRSLATTQTVVRGMLDFLMTNNLITKSPNTPEFSRDVEALIRETETLLRDALDKHGAEVAQVIRAEKGKRRPPKEQGNRSKFLLRLIAGKFAHLFNAPTGAIFPRNIVAGFDDYLFKLLGETLYEELNDESETLLANFNTDDDAEIWREIGENPQHKRFSYNILVRILMRFEDFKWARKNFISIVNNVTERQSGFIFDENHFCILFSSLFSEIFQAAWSDEETLKLDFMFGDGTMALIDRIRDEFRTYKGGLGDAAELTA